MLKCCIFFLIFLLPCLTIGDVKALRVVEGCRNEWSFPSGQLVAVLLVTPPFNPPSHILPPPLLWRITPLTCFQSLLLSPSLPGLILIFICFLLICHSTLCRIEQTQGHTVHAEAYRRSTCMCAYTCANLSDADAKNKRINTTICKPIRHKLLQRLCTHLQSHSPDMRAFRLRTRWFGEVSAQASGKLMAYKGTWILY